MSFSREEKLQKIIETEKILNDIQDIDILLEQLLTEARSIVNADAGSIYIWDDTTKLLSIKYSQNDTQQKKLEPGQKLPYSFFSFPSTPNSFARTRDKYFGDFQITIFIYFTCNI